MMENSYDARPTPFAYPQVGFVAKEVSDRLRVCSSAISYVEDLAEIENTLGKSLVKVSHGRNEVRFSYLPYCYFITSSISFLLYSWGN